MPTTSSLNCCGTCRSHKKMDKDWWIRWVDPRRRSSSDDSEKNLRNPATCVTARELIELRRHARKLDLSRRQPASAQLAGSHASRFRGRGMDYLESRAYQAGDDIRNMDWRVTARAGRPHTKLFQEERERPVVHCLDLGPSLFFATQGALKSVIAARAAILLSWAAAAHGDRVGALLFNGGHHELKPRTGHHGVLRLIQALTEQTDPVQGLAAGSSTSSLNDALMRLRRIARPGSLVFLFSDFSGVDRETSGLLRQLRSHNDLVAVHIVDPLESAPPPPGRYGITDGRDRGILDTRSVAERRRYAAYFEGRRERLEAMLTGQRVPLIRIATTDRVEEVLQSHFGKPAAVPLSGVEVA